jgi:hypothetical protein
MKKLLLFVFLLQFTLGYTSNKLNGTFVKIDTIRTEVSYQYITIDENTIIEVDKTNQTNIIDGKWTDGSKFKPQLSELNDDDNMYNPDNTEYNFVLDKNKLIVIKTNINNILIKGTYYKLESVDISFDLRTTSLINSFKKYYPEIFEFGDNLGKTKEDNTSTEITSSTKENYIILNNQKVVLYYSKVSKNEMKFESKEILPVDFCEFKIDMNKETIYFNWYCCSGENSGTGKFYKRGNDYFMFEKWYQMGNEVDFNIIYINGKPLNGVEKYKPNITYVNGKAFKK